MNPFDWEIAAGILADAIELPAGQRTAFIADRCSRRPELQAVVERLLAAHDAASVDFLLDQPTLSVSDSTAPLDRVGVYRLLREIGSGGMGQVFLGERSDGQFDQRVAVKLLKRGMDSDVILTRFLRERQILASLEHPNVARLIDGGIADDGRPYFVMEHVAGLPITQYCDDHRLSIDERIDLFMLVCGAVEYAHRNLIVHRDLKPSNILVTADRQPKLLDFGIARLIAARDLDAAPDTEALTVGPQMLTPEYAAPEQLRGHPVTTATDVYGAGAVLYELLAGRRPFGREESAARLRAVDVAEPETLSRAVTGAGPTEAAAIAAARGTDPVQLRRRLRGDLDTIVAMSLSDEPERRYASAEALREDLRRYRQHLPVRAVAGSTRYSVSRFLHRHRIGASLAAGMAALVLAFGVTATIQATRIRRQAAALEQERDRATREAAAAQSVSDFLVGVFEVSDPSLVGGGDSISAIALLERGALQIDADLSGQPALQARMLSVIGRAYDNMRRGDQAEPLVERALALQREVHGNDSETVVDALQQLARVRYRQSNFAGAETALLDALAIQERRGVGLRSRDAQTWSLLVDLAGAAHGTGDHDRGARLTADALAMFDRIPADSLGASRASLARLAGLLGMSSGDAERADRVYARFVELQSDATGPRSAATADVYADWAVTHERAGALESADSLMSLALDIHLEIDSAGAGAARTFLHLGGVAVFRGDLQRADSLYRNALAIFRAIHGDDHRSVATTRTQLAEALGRRGMFDEAVELHELALATYERLGDETATFVAPARWRLAVALQGAGRDSEAIAQYAMSLREFTDRFPPDYLLTANVRRDYGLALVDGGRFADAETVLLPGIDVLAARWGDDDFRVDIARIALGRALAGQGRHREANVLLDSVVARLERTRGVEDSIAVRAREAREQALR